LLKQARTIVVTHSIQKFRNRPAALISSPFSSQQSTRAGMSVDSRHLPARRGLIVNVKLRAEACASPYTAGTNALELPSTSATARLTPALVTE
jgi:hypothetical protein